MTYRALYLSNTPEFSAQVVELDELPEGDVELRIDYATLNYKDALALCNKSPIVRTWPMVAGIDAAGMVEHSTHPGFQPGEAVYASQAAWNRLATSLDSPLLGGIVREIALGETIPAAEAMLAGRVVGRYVVEVNR